MSILIESQVLEIEKLLLNNTPFIDLRSEIEFSRGSIPNAINIPILNTLERDLVGKIYKSQGKLKAIELGEDLTKGRGVITTIAAFPSRGGIDAVGEVVWAGASDGKICITSGFVVSNTCASMSQPSARGMGSIAASLASAASSR